MKLRAGVLLCTCVLVASLAVPGVAFAKYSMFSATSWTPKAVSTKTSIKVKGWEWYGSGGDDGPAKRTFVTKRATKYYFASDGEHLKRVSRARFFKLLKTHKQATPTRQNGRSGNVYWKWAKSKSTGKKYRSAYRIEANLIGE
ncbi:MAG TPA: hypothetical protein VFG89_09675 [Coriobacteriia bacterium]|nr:hypothetical protein [Coriobacteriia bacterium]